jgi:DNA-binding transcriptional MerR regulator
MSCTIQKVAKIAGVTLKTLRHYDRVGLLRPAERSEAGYRLYSEEDIEKLQQILFFRELKFPLKKIAEIVNRPDFDRRAALEMQAEHLTMLARRYGRLSDLARQTLENLEGGYKMLNEEMFAAFDYDKMMEHQKQYEAEVQERWGQTDAYRISKERSARYSKEDWAAIAAESDENLKELIACFKENVPHDDGRMTAVCEKARAYLEKYFYPCSLEMFSCLGQMYVADERFTAYYDKFAPGLAAYYNEAIQHYCISKA